MWSVWQTCRTGRRVAGFLGGLLVALLLAAAPAAGATFSDPMTLSNGGAATSPVMAAGVTSSGTEVQVYVAWIEGNEVWLKVGRSPLASPNSCTTGPGALVFDERDRKRLFAVNPSRLAIATYDQAVYVAWLSTRFSGGGSPIQLWSSVGGTESLQDLSFNGVNPNNPAVAADSSGVLVAAEGSVPGGTGVWLARAAGATFSDPYLRVSPTGVVAARRPSIASDGTNKVHVVWRSGSVWYKKFDRGSSQLQLDGVGATTLPSPLPSPSVQFPPKVVVHGSEVTVAWIEGPNPTTQTALRAITTTGGNFPLFSDTIRELNPSSTTMRLANLSLSVGSAERLFGWQEADSSTSTSSNHYLLDAATDRSFESGSYYESVPGLPTAGPSVVRDAAGRVVASWKEIVATTPAIRLGYEGGSGSGDGIQADVRVTPPKVNRRTIDVPGEPSLTVFIQLPNGAEIVEGSVTMNGLSPIRGSTVVGDQNGDGYGDVMMKFSRSVLKLDEAGLPTVPAEKHKVKVKGNMSGGCFFGEYTVDIVQ